MNSTMEEILDYNTPSDTYAYKFKTRTVLIWAAIFLIAILFEARSWVGKSALWMLTTGGITAYAISGMITLKGKHLLNSILFSGGVIWTIYICWGMLFNGGYPYNSTGVTFYFIILAVFFPIV